MAQRLPPLNSLRAFEAAARHLSFSKAAQELFVTPAAISHQIKALEDFLGVRLFRRINNGLLLSDAGQAALPPLRDGFERLAEAVEKARSCDRRQVLTVSAAHSFAGKWLIPRLDRFSQAHPDIDVRIDAAARLADFGRDKVDLALRYGIGDYPGLHVDCLLADEVLPVCSPLLQQSEHQHPLRTPDDLRYHNLLHMDEVSVTVTWPDWKMWLLSAGVIDIDPQPGTRFTGSSMAIQAAIAGQGVALVSKVLVDDDLEAGRLVTPFMPRFPVKFSYYLVCPKDTVNIPKIAAFRNWVLAEVNSTSTDAHEHERDCLVDKTEDVP